MFGSASDAECVESAGDESSHATAPIATPPPSPKLERQNAMYFFEDQLNEDDIILPLSQMAPRVRSIAEVQRLRREEKRTQSQHQQNDDIAVVPPLPTQQPASRKPAPPLRRRDFVVTYWGNRVPAHNFEKYRDRVRYAVWQQERCETQRLHWQMYIECISPECISFIKNTLLEDDTCFVEIRRKSRDQARLYCMKRQSRAVDMPNHGPFEFGEYTQQGARTDLKAIQNDIDDDMPMQELATNHFNTMLRYGNGVRNHRNFRLQEQAQQKRKLDVRVYIGETGSGKTYTAMHEAREILKAYPGEVPFIVDYDGDIQKGTLWFDGYDGNRCVIIDDYDSWMATSFLLRFLDENPLRLPVKGSHTWALFTHVWITSNKHPSEWTSRGNPVDGRHKKALWRRLTKVIEFPDRHTRKVLKPLPEELAAQAA